MTVLLRDLRAPTLVLAALASFSTLANASERATGMAPTAFREFETRIRGGANLSM